MPSGNARGFRAPKDYDPRRAQRSGGKPNRGGAGRSDDRDQSSRGFRDRRDDRGGYSSDRGARGRDRSDSRGGDRYESRGRSERSYSDRDRSGGERFDRGNRFGDRPDRGSGDRPYAKKNRRDDRADRFNDGGRGERSERRGGRDDRPRGERPERRQNSRPERRDYDERPAKSASKGASEDDLIFDRFESQATESSKPTAETWAELGLDHKLCQAIIEMGAPTPFPIQAATVPDLLEGHDVLGRGRTGSGKTLAFAAPLVQRLSAEETTQGGRNRTPRALIVAPTRELAAQIERTVQPLARTMGLFTTLILGGVPQYKQTNQLERGVDIVIGTPGRIEDLANQGHLRLEDVSTVVLDEADQMCDMGFYEPMRRLLRLTKSSGQRILFSATLDKQAQALVDEFLRNPRSHEVVDAEESHADIEHRVLVVNAGAKMDVLTRLVRDGGRVIVFTRTRAAADRVARSLVESGVPSVALHGDIPQNRRERHLAKFAGRHVNTLVATDVAARGIHVDDVDLVIQADMPDEHKTYLHRSGRTGRAGALGTVVTLIPDARKRRFGSLLNHAGIRVGMDHIGVGDDELFETFVCEIPRPLIPEPERSDRGRGGRGGGGYKGRRRPSYSDGGRPRGKRW